MFNLSRIYILILQLLSIDLSKKLIKIIKNQNKRCRIIIFKFLPQNKYSAIGLILGTLGSLAWMSQFIWNWFGITSVDKALYSVLVLIFLSFACACAYVGNRENNTRKVLTKLEPEKAVFRIFIIIFVSIIALIMILNNAAIQMSTSYAQYATKNHGSLTGFRQLTSVTAEDVNELEQWALGIRQIVRAMFLVVPCLIATWGGLSVLTADSIDEAEGGILAIVAAFVVFFITWIFKGIDVTLMFL